MWVGVALSLAALAFVPDDVQPSAQFVIVMALTALFCLNCLHFSIQACAAATANSSCWPPACWYSWALPCTTCCCCSSG